MYIVIRVNVCGLNDSVFVFAEKSFQSTWYSGCLLISSQFLPVSQSSTPQSTFWLVKADPIEERLESRLAPH